MLLPIIFLVLIACTPGDPDDLNPDPIACEGGFILDGSACVPEFCGNRRWGNLPVDEDTIYVDGAAEEGDGTDGAPYATIQSGLDRAGALGGGLVAVAAGIYPENLEFTTEHADVHLAGRCREMTILDASVGDGDAPGIGIDAGFAAVEVSGLTVRGSSQVGLDVVSGQVAVVDVAILGGLFWGVEVHHPGLVGTTELDMRLCLIDGNTDEGLIAFDSETGVTLRDTTVKGTRPNADGEFGRGIEVNGGASLSAERCLVEGNTLHGLYAANPDTRVSLTDTTIRDTRPDANGEFGRGIEVNDGAQLSAEGCIVEGNSDLGLYAADFGTEVLVRDTTVRETRPDAQGGAGRGIGVQHGATLSSEGSLLDGNAEVGLFVSDPGTRVVVRNTTVRDTQPDANGEIGRGIGVQNGATLALEGCLIDGNTQQGLFAANSGTRVIMRDTTVKDTLQDLNGESGQGVEVRDGAILSAEGCLIIGNHDTGLFVHEPGTQVVLQGTTVMDSVPNANGVHGRGIGVQNGATLFLEDCLIQGNTEIGVFATDPGTQVNLRDSTISSTNRGIDLMASVASGATVQDGAVLSGIHLVVRANEGPGLLVNGDRALLECVGCTIQGNQFVGAGVLRGGALTITDSTIEGTTADTNLLGGAGIYAWRWIGAPPTLRLTNTLIQDNPIAGVWLIGDGDYTVMGNTISGGIGESFGSGFRCGDGILALDGVAAWDGSSGLLLQDNMIQDAMGAGVFLDGASAFLDGNAYSGNAMDLVVQNQDCDSIPAWYSEAPQQDLCPIYNYPTCYAEFFFVALPAEPVEEEDDAARRPVLMLSPRSDHPSHPSISR